MKIWIQFAIDHNYMKRNILIKPINFILNKLIHDNEEILK